MPDDDDGELKDGRRFWMTDIKPGDSYRWIGRKEVIRVEDVHWDTQIVYYTVPRGKSPDEIREMRPQRLYEYYEKVK